MLPDSGDAASLVAFGERVGSDCGWHSGGITMHVILANPRGFCAGVDMAVDALETALAAFGTPLFVYHEIVHNRPVVERFRDRGVVFVDSIDEVPANATVLYRRMASRLPFARRPPSETCGRSTRPARW